MSGIFNWGVLAPGQIAGTFSGCKKAILYTQIIAAGSRNINRAEEFASRWNITRAYGSYAQLFAGNSGTSLVRITGCDGTDG